MTQPLRREEQRHNWIMRQAMAFSVFLSPRLPRLERLLRKIWFSARKLRYKWSVRIAKNELGTVFDINQLYWIEPQRIKYASLKEFSIHADKGKIIKGDWDKLERKFEDLDLYTAFKERFEEGKRWEDTIFYQRVLTDISEGEIRWRCKSKSDFDRRCNNLDTLFQNIKNDGFRTQSRTLPKDNVYDPTRFEDEITVNVGREGDLLFNNGAHRLSIAKLLGIKKVPVRITVRHPEWVYFKKQILLYSKEQLSGKMYQAITHPDLQDIGSLRDLEFDRFRIIQNNLSTTRGHLLDIGAHWGYFCHKFEEMGFNCCAVENNELALYFLRKLKRAEGKHFQVITESIFDYRGINDTYFDVVLALNIFHHFLKQKSTYIKLINLLNNLNMEEMYFQPHCVSEEQMQGAYKNYNEKEFVDFILSNTKLTQMRLLGTDEDGRGIYKLY